MLITENAPLNAKQTFKWEEPIKSLTFRVFLRGGGTVKKVSAIKDALMNSIFTAVLNDKKSSNLPIVQQVPVLHLMHYQSFREGKIWIESNTSGNFGHPVAGAVATVAIAPDMDVKEIVFELPLTGNANALQLLDDEKIEFTFEPHADLGGYDMDVYGNQSQHRQGVALDFGEATIDTTSKYKSFDALKWGDVVFPVTANLEKVELRHTNGQTTTYLKFQLLQMMRQSNDIDYIIDGALVADPTVRTIILPCSSVTECKVYLTDKLGYTFYPVKLVSFTPNQDAAAGLNARLKKTIG